MENNSRRGSVSSNSSGDIFNVGPYDVETEEAILAKEKKLEEKEAKRNKLNGVYHNCFFGKQTKAEKAERKLEKRRKKRKVKRAT